MQYETVPWTGPKTPTAAPAAEAKEPAALAPEILPTAPASDAKDFAVPTPGAPPRFPPRGAVALGPDHPWRFGS